MVCLIKKKPSSDAISAENSSLRLIKDLGLRHRKKISQEALVAAVKERWPEGWERVLGELIDSGFIKTFYVVDLKRKTPEQGLEEIPWATHNQIQHYVEVKYGFVPKSAWITEVKEECGIPPAKRNYVSNGKTRPKTCPKEIVNWKKGALLFYGLI
jgi:hypothetical protein